MKRIILTGSSGFLGSNIIRVFQDLKIMCIKSNNTNDDSTLKISWNHLNQDWFNKCNADFVIHCAAKAHDLKNLTNVNEYYTVNRDLTIKLYKLFLKSECKTFVFISSVKAIADELDDDILTEEYEAKPSGPYGNSKREAEEFILRNIPEGKRVIILRPTMIYGPGNKGNLNILYKFINKGMPWPLGSFNNKRSFLSVNNFLFVLQNIFQGKVKTGVYNLSDDEYLSTNDLINYISIALGKQPRIIYLPKYFIAFLVKFGDFLNLSLNSDRFKKLTENYCVSNLKIKDALNIQKMPFKSSDELIKTIKTF